MGRILAGLRFKKEKKKKAHLKSSLVPSKTKEPLLLFVSMFVSEGSPCERVADLNSQEDIGRDILDREFRDEIRQNCLRRIREEKAHLLWKIRPNERQPTAKKEGESLYLGLYASVLIFVTIHKDCNLVISCFLQQTSGSLDKHENMPLSVVSLVSS